MTDEERVKAISAIGELAAEEAMQLLLKFVDEQSAKYDSGTQLACMVNAYAIVVSGLEALVRDTLPAMLPVYEQLKAKYHREHSLQLMVHDIERAFNDKPA